MVRAELEINGIGYMITAVVSQAKVGHAAYSMPTENNYNNIEN